jgi:hypothetical protein
VKETALTQSTWIVGGRVRGNAQPVTLRIEADDVVDLIDDRWNTFVGTRRVGAFRPAVAGAPFWSVIDGGDAASLYARVLERAREHRSVGFDITSVSKSERGRIVLTTRPADGGAVDLSLRTIHSRPTPPLALFDPSAERTDEEVTACGFCQRVFGFSWQEADVGLRQLRIDPLGAQPRLRTTICDDCERAVYASCKASPLSF